MLLKPNAYGDRTQRVRDVFSLVDGSSIFVSTTARESRDDAKTAMERHLAAMGMPLRARPAIFASGSPSALAARWRRASAWRQRVRRRFDESKIAKTSLLARPPVWAEARGATNVFASVFVARAEVARECRLVADDPHDADALWEMVCFFEEVIDSALQIALVADVAQIDPFRPLLSVVINGYIPLVLDEDEIVLHSKLRAP